jgi:CheY-like chemotaxis protein
MTKNVLFVDDNRILCRFIQKKFHRCKDKFSVITATNGLDALDKLKENSISLIITNIQMPQMDGFSLLTHLSKFFPDIPVIVQTGQGTPKTKQIAMESGAFSYIEQPFKIEDLGQLVLSILEKESDGGILKKFSLEMFIQLIEMEMKTCTVRVTEKTSGEQGVLFFWKGDLMDARICDRRGTQVAFEIFCWDNATFSIQDDCRLTKKKIDEDLQSLIFEAIRYKDESEARNETIKEKTQRHQLPTEITQENIPSGSHVEATNAALLNDILELEDVKGVMSIAMDGTCNFSQFSSQQTENIININWQSFFQTLNGVYEAELVFENMRIFLRKTVDGYILVVLGKAVPVEMVRRSCDRLASKSHYIE